MAIFKGNVAKGLKQTKSQEKIFNALKKGINENDDIAKETGLTAKVIKEKTATLVNNMFVRRGSQTPIFLQSAEAQNAIGDVYTALVDSKTMSKFHTRNIKSLIYHTFPNDPKLRSFPPLEFPCILPLNCFLNFGFFGCNITYSSALFKPSLEGLSF